SQILLKGSDRSEAGDRGVLNREGERIGPKGGVKWIASIRCQPEAEPRRASRGRGGVARPRDARLLSILVRVARVVEVPVQRGDTFPGVLQWLLAGSL